MVVRVAALDCGTNSLRLLITDVDPDSTTKTDVVRDMRIVRLGQDIDRTGRFAPEALERAGAVMHEYAQQISQLGVQVTRFCATSAARDAANVDELERSVREILGVDLEVLTGAQEAEASFLGATKELADESAVVVDVGGGSTEFVRGRAGTVEWSTSLDVGSVRMTERFLASDPPSVDEIVACESFLDAQFDAIAADIGPVVTLIGVAGTITTMAVHTLGASSYDSSQIHAARLYIEDLRTACSDMVRRSVAERRSLPFMHPGRADVIGAGAIIVDRLLDRLQLTTDQVTVSEHDILDGIAWTAPLDPQE